MLIGNFDKLHTSIPFEVLMQKQTKELAKEICRYFGISIRSSLRKKEYISLMSSAILDCPDLWLCQLDQYEVLLLKKLVDAGPEASVHELEGITVCTLIMFGFILIDNTGTKCGEVNYVICDELREAITPHLDVLIASGEQQEKWEIEQYALGLLNLYGMIPYAEFIDRLSEEWKSKGVSKAKLLNVIESGSLKHLIFEMIDLYVTKAYVQSPFLEYPDDLDQQLYQHREIDKYKSFTKDEIFEAGKMPYPTMPTAAGKRLKHFMINKLQMTEGEVKYFMKLLWLEKQSGELPMSIITAMIGEKLHSMNELQSAINLFVEYLNSLPCWFLRGYSSEESFELSRKKNRFQQPPQLVAGPNMKAMGLDITPEEQMRFNEMFEKKMTSSKIERNAPCPCGSGRKYKHCCGCRN